MKRISAVALAAVAIVSASPAFATNFILTSDGVIDAANASHFYITSLGDPTVTPKVTATLTNTVTTTPWSDSYYFAPSILRVGTGSAITSDIQLIFGTPGL